MRAALGCLVHERHLVILGPVIYMCGTCSMSHDTLFNFTNEVVLLDLCNLYYLAFYGLRYVALAILQIVCSAISNSVPRLSDGISVRCNCLLFSH